MGERAQPWDFAQAMQNSNNIKSAQANAETTAKNNSKAYAEAEEKYRLALALEIVRQHSEEGVAWSVAPDLARGNEKVARLRKERDIAEGVKEASLQALWRLAADRRDLGRFIDWSAKIDVGLHLHGDREHEPDAPEVIGARRAA